MSEMSWKILEKMPAEKRWAWAGQNYTAAYTGLGMMLLEILGQEKWQEINDNLWSEGGKISYPLIKEAFNIPVEDAIGAYKVVTIAAVLPMGPEFEDEMVEVTPERVVWKTTKCPWMERAKEFGQKHETMTCPGGHKVYCEEGLKAINPKISFKLTKAMPLGDPYCENVIEFKK